jgi:hypothetical protein
MITLTTNFILIAISGAEQVVFHFFVASTIDLRPLCRREPNRLDFRRFLMRRPDPWNRAVTRGPGKLAFPSPAG